MRTGRKGGGRQNRNKHDGKQTIGSSDGGRQIYKTVRMVEGRPVEQAVRIAAGTAVCIAEIMRAGRIGQQYGCRQLE